MDARPKLDLGFKEGQTIKLSIGNITTKKGGASKPKTAGTGGLSLLPPPPGGKVTIPPPSSSVAISNHVTPPPIPKSNHGVFFQKYSHIHKEKTTLKEVPHRALECMKENLTMEDKDWSCCPKNWTSFGSNCYFISVESGTWDESEKKCSSVKTHLLVITAKAEQEFIIQKLDKSSAYYVGLSDLQGKNNWQWVDQTPYNESATFWHSGEPNDLSEHCVILHFRASPRKWGWNDVRCNQHQKFICKMMKIYL
uniref:NECAP endocytosis associated 1 n=1 Tax=Sus scrofa TaxID=9823 RepID=A0A8D1XMF0_PIG